MELFLTPQTLAEQRDDGSVVLTSALPVGTYWRNMAEPFRETARAHPDRLLAADRDGDLWRRVTYGEALRKVDGLAQMLLEREAAGRPVMILSGNSVEHLLFTLACYTVGSPVVPVSTAYSLLDASHGKLRHMAELVEPAVVFADDARAYREALDLVGLLTGAQIIAGREEFSRWTSAESTALVGERLAQLNADTVAKILFTSGSTGLPKGVINTHRMLCANQRMLQRIWPFLADESPVMLDWLPWSHTFGGNHNLGLALANGGTISIDDGRPGPEMIERTVRNLAEVRPSVYFNVPAGYASLLPRLEADRALAEAFYARMRFVFFAAAALPQALWEGLSRVAASVGSAARMTTSWGCTETAPAATSAYFASDRSDCIGVPLPGVSIKLAPVGPKLEIRVKGPCVTPGYYRAPDKNEAAFDEEGYYRTGDAVQMVDKTDPEAGLVFDGRINEDFKLATGTWVSVGTLRPALLTCSEGLLSDAVLTGHDGADIGALCWLNPAVARKIAGADDFVQAPAVRDAVAAALARLNADASGSSRRIARALILDEPASLGDGELTDKGYVNQRAVLDRRRPLVELLHAEPVADEVILPEPPPHTGGPLRGNDQEECW